MILPAEPKRGNIRLSFRLGEITLASPSRLLAFYSFDPSQSLVDLSGMVVPAVQGTDGWLLEGVPSQDSDQSALRSSPWLVYCKSRYERHLANISGGYDMYLAKFSSKSRSTLKRKLRKFADASNGKIHWHCYCRPDEMAEFYRLGRDISKLTYQERLIGAGLPDSATFEADLIRRAETGSARGYILFLGERPVSYLYLPIEGQRAIYAFLGYDPSVSELSPGTVLQLLAMEDLCNNSTVTLFDFTQGGGQHKEMFATSAVRCVDLLFLKPTLANRLLVGCHKSWVSFEGVVGRALDWLGIKKLIRHWLRNRMATF